MTEEDIVLGNKKLCKCGCGEWLKRVDSLGRSRDFKKGHSIEITSAGKILMFKRGHMNKVEQNKIYGKQRYNWSPTHPRSTIRGYVKEHILSVEKYLTKQFGVKVFISKQFDIHHINEDKTNNNISNLQLITKNQHTFIHHNKKRI